MGRGNKNKRKIAGPSLADQADKHILYEDSVQCVEAEIDFVDSTFSTLKNRQAAVIREDFCGTTNSSCEWIKRRESNSAFAVDLDPEVLEWGRRHHVEKLSAEQQSRLNIITADVLKSGVKNVDAVLAMNFSYWIFKTREQMVRYYRSVYESLVDDGVFFWIPLVVMRLFRRWKRVPVMKVSLMSGISPITTQLPVTEPSTFTSNSGMARE